jgi:hypothetical protein
LREFNPTAGLHPEDFRGELSEICVALNGAAGGCAEHRRFNTTGASEESVICNAQASPTVLVSNKRNWLLYFPTELEQLGVDEILRAARCFL